jgi:hypothetical protein
VLPHLWFRNTWAWDQDHTPPAIEMRASGTTPGRPSTPSSAPGTAAGGGRPRRLPPGVAVLREPHQRPAHLGTAPRPHYPKDGINDHVLTAPTRSTREGTGTKAHAWYVLDDPAGETRAAATLSEAPPADDPRPGTLVRQDVFAARRAEADEFYAG